jgi:hypothetical protein
MAALTSRIRRLARLFASHRESTASWLARRTDYGILRLLLQPTEHRIEPNTCRNRHKNSGCELNLVGCRDGICFWRKHTRRADPLWNEVADARTGKNGRLQECRKSAASATFALKAGVWFRRGRLVMVSPDSLGTACPLSGRNSTYRPVQISETSSYRGKRGQLSVSVGSPRCSPGRFGAGSYRHLAPETAVDFSTLTISAIETANRRQKSSNMK